MEELQSLIEADYEVRDSVLILHCFVCMVGPLIHPTCMLRHWLSPLQVGATIKEKLIAKAVSWYTGEAIEDEPYGFYGEDEDEGEE